MYSLCVPVRDELRSVSHLPPNAHHHIFAGLLAVLHLINSAENNVKNKYISLVCPETEVQ